MKSLRNKSEECRLPKEKERESTAQLENPPQKAGAGDGEDSQSTQTDKVAGREGEHHKSQDIKLENGSS